MMIKKVRIPILLSAFSMLIFSCGGSNESKVNEEEQKIEEVKEEPIDTDAIDMKEGETPLDAVLREGKGVYESKCQVCHASNGNGIDGEVPPLAYSEFLNNHIEKGISIVLNGIEGEINVNGQKFEARMPKLGLSESEVASVLSYVLNEWGNSGDIITKYEVRDVANRINPMVDDATLTSMIGAGKAIYMEKCRLCHLEDGAGQEGITPPLNNSNFLLKNIDKGIEFVTNGYSGEITVNGKTYNGTMPAQGLTEEQTAQVFTYILNSWDNPGIVLTGEDVTNVLSKLEEGE